MDSPGTMRRMMSGGLASTTTVKTDVQTAGAAVCPNGKHRCEKCNWVPEENTYATID